MLRYYTSCAQRRLEQYEGLSWWSFLGGDGYSPAFQRYLSAIPRTMVAMDARRGSARTIGDVSMQLMVDYGARGDGNQIDRLLCGPTTDKWLRPWQEHLTRLGVVFHLGCPVQALHMREGRLSGIEVAGSRMVRADHYVLAVPLEAVRPLISQAVAQADPALGRLRRLPQARFDELTSWMNGVQFYLRRDVPMVQGHMFYPDSPWALTSISQPQFWREDGPFAERFGDGQVHGLISVDVSDWETLGHYVGKAARACTPDEVAREIWQQLRAASGGALREDDLLSWHLDDELVPRPDGGGFDNRARLLVHPPGSWQLRPEAVSAIPNLVLAADYVRTHTDLATMEGANEAARRAVNGILLRSGSSAAPCAIHALREPAIFDSAKRLDERLLGSTLAGGRHAFDLLPGRAQGLTPETLVALVGELLGGRPAATEAGSADRPLSKAA